ncbi:hypothetical protein DPMN_135460 [Dreissena polymorpha]|uniref:Uncharacterized protein n=1 Tax=Dreissena polymorpha TaxID=45954 RepID=A0A9D4JGV6_DREPO|nr:hypothetical protein DPMN_135460 [Dreissena polymorpha]
MRKKDEVFIIVKNDFLLSTYAKSLLEEGKEHSDTSWTVRLLAKLLISIREVSNCESYSWMALIITEHWNEIIHGVKTLSEFTFSESGIIVEKPNIALKCCQGIKGLIAAAEGIALRQNDDVLLKKIEKMFKMYDGEWAKISKHCNNSIRTKKEDQVELLPLTSDITKLKEKTVTEIKS